MPRQVFELPSHHLSSNPEARDALRGLRHVDVDPDRLDDPIRHPDVADVDSFPGELRVEPGVDEDLTISRRPGLRHVRDILRQDEPVLDLAAFGQDLWQELQGEVAGYALQIRHRGARVHVGRWNWARTPDDGGEGWDMDTPMHIASVSKLITAIAVVHLLDDIGVEADAPFSPYLPDHWQRGPNIDGTTFAQLLRHEAGFRAANTDYLSMRQAIADGVELDKVGDGSYLNMNYGLCRILVAIASGKVDADVLTAPAVSEQPTWQDQWWDHVTVDAYRTYVRDHVLKPSGVYTATLVHPSTGALAYDSAGADPGWDSGNTRSVSGGAGWHMSLDHLLDVMGQYRRGGRIIQGEAATAALDNGFGIDVAQSTPSGRLWCKNGRWTDSKGRTEQCVAVFLPGGIELAVYVNSFVGSDKRFLRTIVLDLCREHLG